MPDIHDGFYFGFCLGRGTILRNTGTFRFFCIMDKMPLRISSEIEETAYLASQIKGPSESSHEENTIT